MSHQIRVTRLTVSPPNARLFHQSSTHVAIDDEGAGEFIKVEQNPEGATDCSIAINPEEWPALREAIDRIHAELRQEP